MMKKAIILLQLILISTSLNAQNLPEPPQITPNGIFDEVSDSYGNRYSLAELQISQSKLYNNSVINSLSSYSCSAGYFDLYFAANSYFDGGGTPESDRRAVLCQVFTDISNFISSPLATGGNTVRVNIYCDNLAQGNPAAAAAGAFYVYLGGASNPNQGILDNQIQKAIVSGVNPYANLPISIFGAPGFFYGAVFTSSNPPQGGTFNYSMSTSTITSTQVDYYTVMLHEVCHALGIGTFIGSNGVSVLGAANNYYSRYDLFLKNASGTSLLASSTLSCANSNLTGTASASFVNPSNCSTTLTLDDSNCGTACQYSSATVQMPVFTPSCYVYGSSLSHFEDQCSIGSGTVSATCYSANGNSNNNLYYVMANSTSFGDCYIKRYLKPQERLVLCDLGYSVKNVYSSSASSAAINGTANSFNYSGGNCPGSNIWGVHDGIAGNVYTLTTNSNSLSIPVGTLLSNDSPTTAVGVSCVEIMYTNTVTNASASLSGTNVIVTATQGSGLQIFKYLPVNSSGEFGNITYVYVYFISGGCTPPDPCNIVQNGGFENVASGGSYGQLFSSLGPGPVLNCWDTYSGTPDLFTRNSTGTAYDLGVNTLSLSPVVDSYTGSPNNRILGCGYQPGTHSETFINYLGAPLVPGNSYQLSMWVYNHSGTLAGGIPVNANFEPLVVTVASSSVTAFIPIPSFPNGLDVIAQFTINPCNVWTAVTTTFVFSPSVSVNHNALVMGPAFQSMTATSNVYYSFFDDIQLIPLPVGTFSLPPTVPCGNTTFTNLAQYTSTLYPGTFSGTGVTFTNNMYHFNASGTLTTGNYPIGFTYTNGLGCPITIWQNVFVMNSLSLTTTSFSYCSNLTPSVNLNATHSPLVSGVNYTWQPGNLSGFSPTVHPTSNTVYTVSATSGSCSASATLAVNVSSTCCPPSAYPSFTSSTVSGTTFGSPMVFLNSFTIQANQSVSFSGSEFLFAPSVKITVDGGAHLTIGGSHLYGCSGDMWQGIEVLDGADVTFNQESGKDNLIEDAITAVDISNHTTTTQTISILAARYTTFNKNYIDINISNYTKTLSTYPFLIENCVFTCRDLSSAINATAWPSTGTNSAVSSIGAELRTVVNSTTGFAPPFINPSFSQTTLKNPYSTQPSQIAIQLSTVGIVSGTIMYGISIGNEGNLTGFNVFDYHKFGIFKINSSTTLRNNVFQNTTGGAMLHPEIGGGQAKIPSAAISGYATAAVNVKLDMAASGYSGGNKFWNCHRSIMGSNIYYTDIKYSILRSTQTSTATGIQQGNQGINLASNRFNYFISNNELTNIANGINISISTGTFASVGTTLSTNGTNAGRIYVYSNSLSTGTLTNSYMDNGITVNSSLSNTVTVPSNTVYPFLYGMKIHHNILNNVYRGIALIGNGAQYPSSIDNNTVNLTNDPGNTLQWGINITNTSGKNTVNENLLSATNTTNTNQALVYCTDNMGVASPSISCNTATNCNRGFVFVGANGTPTAPACLLWAGNEMKLLNTAMLLTVGSGSVLGIIGPQGAANFPSDNKWTGSVTCGAYAANGSIAQLSPLTVKNTTPFIVPSPSGSGANPGLYYSGSNATISTSSGAYDCGEFVSARNVTLSPTFATNIQRFSYKNTLYRHLHFNDSIRSANSTLNMFYGDHADSSVAALLEIEQALYDGEFSPAASLISGFSPTNDAETHYKSFYTLYKSYAENNFENIVVDDSSALFSLANSCPEGYGTAVYHARSLYNHVFRNTYLFPSACGASRPEQSFLSSLTPEQNDEDLKFDIYPNPASGSISISSNLESLDIKLTIKDIGGRVVVAKDLQIRKFIAKLDLSLFDGAYIVTITSNSKEVTSKKLIIAK